MRADFLPFARPSIGDADIAAVVEILRSGWITTGAKNAEFETEFSRYVGAPGAVALCSATAGMHVALAVLGVGAEDELITPSMTWVSTANLAVLSGAKPVFADVDRNTLMVTPDSVSERTTGRTKVIVPVHFAGAPVDLMPLRRLAALKGIHLIEDAAHALGTEYMGERIGRRGTAIFSFHPIKNITTGEGGMLCSDDTRLLDRIRQLKFHGLGVDAYDRLGQGRVPQAEVLEPGFKYNLTDMAAALGITQLAQVDEFNRKRTELASHYAKRLAAIDEILPLASPGYSSRHAWHLFIVRLDIDRAGISRDEFMAELKERNIGTGLHFRAIHLQKYYRETMGFRRGMLPNTEWNSDRILSLPLFPAMTEADIDDVVAAIRDVLAGRKGR
ncbi:MAG: UDP-4-amino-4-deoxy-L-arabinose aminotransferase [Lentisphaerae bacterium]|nr:UDP-4-amino-4-deoxy-L-arabinose aminotransferase [Lentisphaerota bacterium]MBT4817937.1 UDP-4-amino-4-deoxy-L-arabinose aminotransferase [Lentisphaerota bacterium]MBT5606190.1 UDP-4-amino-4-deoxy-L-arabinose aminotransferase [Lentisphaerota bacterium]MBT7057721.1 UDP-4-amino-4-deoxy-L-arabinose aminotransferase [Lentisphaerota bacterium]MBT7845507.1 UDP-4-amino-4-deoxy-L-arabinose aminotransferase [Lentisphaerota bacterium]